MRPRLSTILLVWMGIIACNNLRVFGQAPTGNPGSVPLKIWVVGEVKSDGTAPWQMSLSGAFLPTQPGGTSPAAATSNGFEQMLVEKMVTLNGVPCEPFREYTILFESQ